MTWVIGRQSAVFQKVLVSLNVYLQCDSRNKDCRAIEVVIDYKVEGLVCEEIESKLSH